MVFILSCIPKNTFVNRAFSLSGTLLHQNLNIYNKNLSKKSVCNLKMDNIEYKIYTSISNELFQKYYIGSASIYSVIDTKINFPSGISNYKIIEYNKIKKTDNDIKIHYNLNIQHVYEGKLHPIFKISLEDNKEGFKIDLNHIYKGDAKVIYDHVCELTKLKDYISYDL
jgi:hypothetical protein